MILLAASIGCDRGPRAPEPAAAPAEGPTAASAERTAPPLTAEQMSMLELPAGHTAGQLPRGHPPTGDMPVGHPMVEVPSGHPPAGAGALDALGGERIDPTHPTLAGVAWSATAPLVARPPSRPMRNGEYAVTGADGEAVMAVFHFPGMGGAVQDNITRWAGQFRTEAGEPAQPEVDTREVSGLRVTRVKVSGVFASGMPGGAAGPTPQQAMLGAIVEGPQGPLFFKMVGPASTVASAEAAFDTLLSSLTIASRN